MSYLCCPCSLIQRKKTWENASAHPLFLYFKVLLGLNFGRNFAMSTLFFCLSREVQGAYYHFLVLPYPAPIPLPLPPHMGIFPSLDWGESSKFSCSGKTFPDSMLYVTRDWLLSMIMFLACCNLQGMWNCCFALEIKGSRFRMATVRGEFVRSIKLKTAKLTGLQRRFWCTEFKKL